MATRRQGPRPGPSHETPLPTPSPRRVRHLIVLPGGGAPEEPTGRADQDEGYEHRSREPSPRRGESRADTGADKRGLSAGGPAAVEVTALLGPSSPTLVGTGAAQAAAVAVEALPLPATEPQRLKLSLRVISRTVSAPRAPGIPFILFASALVSAAILGLVVLNVMVDQSSFRLGQLDGQVTAQQAQLRQLDYAVSVGEAPARIAALAARIGMVPAGEVKALAPTATSVTPATPATASPSAAASQPAPLSPPGLTPGSTATVTHR